MPFSRAIKIKPLGLKDEQDVIMLKERETTLTTVFHEPYSSSPIHSVSESQLRLFLFILKLKMYTFVKHLCFYSLDTKTSGNVLYGRPGITNMGFGIAQLVPRSF